MRTRVSFHRLGRDSAPAAAMRRIPFHCFRSTPRSFWPPARLCAEAVGSGDVQLLRRCAAGEPEARGEARAAFGRLRRHPGERRQLRVDRQRRACEGERPRGGAALRALHGRRLPGRGGGAGEPRLDRRLGERQGRRRRLLRADEALEGRDGSPGQRPKVRSLVLREKLAPWTQGSSNSAGNLLDTHGPHQGSSKLSPDLAQNQTKLRPESVEHASGLAELTPKLVEPGLKFGRIFTRSWCIRRRCSRGRQVSRSQGEGAVGLGPRGLASPRAAPDEAKTTRGLSERLRGGGGAWKRGPRHRSKGEELWRRRAPPEPSPLPIVLSEGLALRQRHLDALAKAARCAVLWAESSFRAGLLARSPASPLPVLVVVRRSGPGATPMRRR